MPILIKKLEGEVLSYLDPLDTTFNGGVRLVTSIIGEVGLEDYFKITMMEGLTQDFSEVIRSEYYATPNTFGVKGCGSFYEIVIE